MTKQLRKFNILNYGALAVALPIEITRPDYAPYAVAIQITFMIGLLVGFLWVAE